MTVNSTSLLDRLNNKSLLKPTCFVAGERAAVLRKWHDLMVAQVDDLGAILTA